MPELKKKSILNGLVKLKQYVYTRFKAQRFTLAWNAQRRDVCVIFDILVDTIVFRFRRTGSHSTVV